MLDREQLFRDVTAPNAPFVTDVLQDHHRQARMHIKKDAYLTRTGVRQGDNLGPGLFRRSYDAATQEWNEQLDARPWARRLVVRCTPLGLPEASIDLSVSGYADDLARAAVGKNLTELGQINREQTDSLRAALESRAGIVLLRAAGRNSMKDHPAACAGAWPAPEHISLQAKYLGALPAIESTAKAECRARCQAARPPLLSTLRFFRSQAPQRFKVLVFKVAIVSTLFTGTTLFGAQCSHVRTWPYRQETGSFSDPSSRSLPSSCDPATAKAAEMASEATHLGAVHGTSVPTPCSSLRHLLVVRASSKDRWDFVTYCASPPSDHCGRPQGCCAAADLADLECGFDTRPIVHAE